MTLFRFPPRLMVLQVGRSTSTGKSSEARSANGLKGVAGFQPGENQNPLPRAAGRFDHHPPLAAPGGPAPLGWNNPPPPRWNASESASIVCRCPHDIRSTKKTPLRRKRP